MTWNKPVVHTPHRAAGFSLRGHSRVSAGQIVNLKAFGTNQTPLAVPQTAGSGHVAQSFTEYPIVLEGSDPALKDEYVVYSAHMDHEVFRPSQPDSIFNGADDNASGTAGLLEIAEAFAGASERPRRSI